MSKRSTNDDRFINDQLAEFVDQVMEGQAKEVSAPDDTGILSDLQQVVLDIHQSISNQPPDPQMAKRIQRNVIRSWSEDDSQGGLISQIRNIFSPQDEWESNAQRQRRVAGQLALAVIIILAVLLPLVQFNDSLPGSATGDAGLTTLFSILIIIGALTAWILWRGRK